MNSSKPKPRPEIVKPHQPGQEHATPDERVDEAIDESFPASDPPSWNAGAKNDVPARRKIAKTCDPD